MGRAPGRSRVLSRAGAVHHFAGRKNPLSESQSVSRSRLELARDEVDHVFGDGHAAAHPELVVAIVHAASSDWAARVICAALEDIAGALVEGGVELPGNAGLVAARSIVRP
jgi:hypothetical protein